MARSMLPLLVSLLVPDLTLASLAGDDAVVGESGQSGPDTAGSSHEGPCYAERMRRHLVWMVLSSWSWMACASDDVAADGEAGTSTGDGDGDPSGDGDSSGDGDGPSNAVVSLELAQTHVLAGGEKTWTLGEDTRSLHVIGGRSLLALVTLEASPEAARIEAWSGDALLGSVDLDPPAALPATEDGGQAYADAAWTAELDAAWIRPGLGLRVVADEVALGQPTLIPVGVDSEFRMVTLPFYLFGANPGNSVSLAEAAAPDAEAAAELRAKWPIAEVDFVAHPGGRIEWPSIVVGPRDGNPAMLVSGSDEQLDGFAVMSAVLGVLRQLREANGEGPTNNQYYAPLMMLDTQGGYAGPGGGLGGGNVGTGDHTYAGIFIHEQGHAFGMPHAADAYADGSYPYVGGSLLGSAWGYDQGRRELLAPWIPASASHADDCLTDGAHQIDAEGRCVKQDPMQSGSGDQAEGYRYTMFSDFNASVIQRWFEGETSLAEGGEHEYAGGVVFVDPDSSSGYSRWDAIDQARVEVGIETTDKGLYGFDGGLPTTRDVPVHAIVVAISRTDASLTRVYPPLSFVGNLRREVDPSDPEQRAAIVPNTGEYPWYCHASGCDYTLRVTYTDASVHQVLIRGGFRAWFGPLDEPPASTLDPSDGASFRLFAVNVPGDAAISSVELLDTPMGWTEPPANPAVVASWAP